MMKLLIVLCLWATVVFGGRISLQPEDKEVRIIEGEDARAGQIPWQVSLSVDVKGKKNRCGGSFVHPNFVVTAAKCVYDASSIDLRFGSTKFDEGGEFRTSQDYRYHEKYVFGEIDYDIALILIEDVVYLNENISLISIPKRGHVLETGAKLLTSGFGLTGNAGFSDTLKFIDVVSVSKESCQISFPITNNQVCCTAEGQKCISTGDSGSALAQTIGDKTFLVGVASFSSSAGCHYGLPFGFTRTGPFVDWIHTTMGEM